MFLLRQILYHLHVRLSLNMPEIEFIDMELTKFDIESSTQTATSVIAIDARMERRVRMKIDCVVLPLVSYYVVFEM